jgi:hypothetical protein
LNSELSSGKPNLDEVVLAGAELKKNAPKADDVTRLDRDIANVKDRYEGLAARCSDKLAKLEEALPLLHKFHDEHERLLDWLQRVEPELHAGGKEPTGPEAVKQLEVCLLVKQLETDTFGVSIKYVKFIHCYVNFQQEIFYASCNHCSMKAKSMFAVAEHNNSLVRISF